MRKLFVYIFLTLVPLSLGAQALPFTSADYNPATLAKGGASLTETSTVAYAAFANPATIAFYDGKGDTSIGYTMWQPNSVKTDVIVSGDVLKFGDKFGIGVGLCYGLYPEYTITDLTGYEKGTFKPTNIQFGVGLAYKVLPFLSIGANIGYAGETLAEGSSSTAVDADVFAMVQFGGFKAALGVSELGGKVTSAAGTAFSIPTAANLGLGYTLKAGEKHGIDFNADLQYYLKDGVAAAVGASYAYNDMIFVRTGYRYGGKTVIPSFASAGVGVKFYGVKLDLAYVLGSGAMANTLALSLGYAF